MQSLIEKADKIRMAKRILISDAVWVVDSVIHYEDKTILRAHMEGDTFVRDFDLKVVDIKILD